jgi:hypothetical protein
MVTAVSLQQQVNEKVNEIKQTVGAVGEEKGSRRPGDAEWCVKEILSHLCGEEGHNFMDSYTRFIDEDTPLIGIVSGLPYYTPARQSMTVSDLLSQVESQYQQIAQFLGGLSDEQLNRKGRVPLLKDTPLGEYPTLALFAGGLINFHLGDHINQLRNLCK